MARAHGVAVALFLAMGIENLDQNTHSGYELTINFEAVFHFRPKRIDAQDPDVRVQASERRRQVGRPSPANRLTNDRHVEAANANYTEVGITRKPS